MNLGVAHFIEPDEPESSAVMLHDGKSLKEVSHWTEIPSDTVWLSNVNKAALSVAKIGNIPYLKSAQYLSTSYDAIRREMMISGDVKGERAERHLKRLVEIFQFIIEKQEEGLSGIKLQEHSALITSIMAKIKLNSDESLSPSFLDVVNDCYTLSVTVPGQKVEASNRVITLSYPKAPYAYHILSQSIPSGSWSNVNRTDERFGKIFELRGSHLDTELEKIAAVKAGFLKVALVNRKDNEQLTVLRLSNPGGQWLTLIEAAELNKMVSIKVLDAFLSEGLTPVEDVLKKYGIRKPQKEELISMSLGLSLTETWKALISEKIVASDNAIYYTPVATYLKAVDRLTCMEGAKAVIDRGFDVNAYGNNLISASVSQDKVSPLLELGYEKGLVIINGEGQEVVAEHKMTSQKQQGKGEELEPYRPPLHQ